MHVRRILLAALLTAALALTAMAGPQASKNKSGYRSIEVTPFEVANGLDLPPDYLNTFMADLQEELTKLDWFSQILRPGEKAAPENLPTLKLTGVITHFRKGSIAAALGGIMAGAAGKTDLDAQVTLSDGASGEKFTEEVLYAQVPRATIGGKSTHPTVVLAKQITKLIKKKGQNLSPPSTSPAAQPSPAAPPTAP
jgi:hypothetical protein